MKPLLLAMMGLPRSGKSTVAKQLAKEYGAPIVSRDALRLAMLGVRYVKEAEPLIKTFGLYMIKALFLAGHSMVIFDETNYSKEAREGLKSSEWFTAFYDVPTRWEVCCERALLTHQIDLTDVILEMWARHDPPDPSEAIVSTPEQLTVLLKVKG